MNLDSVIDAREREIVQQELAVLRMAPSSDGWMTRAEVARFWQCSWETAASRLAQPGAPQQVDVHASPCVAILPQPHNLAG